MPMYICEPLPKLYQHSNDVLQIWVTAERVAIRYRDLETDHLANIIAMIRRNYWEFRYPNLMDYAKLRKIRGV